MKKLILAFVAVASVWAASILTFKEGDPQTLFFDTWYPYPWETAFYSQSVGQSNGATVTNLVLVRRFSASEVRFIGTNSSALPYTYAVNFDKGFAVNNYALVTVLATNVVDLTTGAVTRMESLPSDGAMVFQVRPEKPGNARRFQ